MAGLASNPHFEIALRRFGERQLTGSDLEAIRTSLLRLSQEELASVWGVSRNVISKAEGMNVPSLRTCDAYRGLMLLQFLEGSK